MKSKLTKTESSSIAASIAPEDLRCGDYIAILNEVIEFPSFFWCDMPPSERDELIRVRFRPRGGGMPLAVKAICLPFVFVRSPLGGRSTIDLRQAQLVRLKRRYAKAVWKELKKQRRKSKHGGFT